MCNGHDYRAPGKPRIDWTDLEAHNALVSALVTDANAVLAALTGAEADEVAAAAPGRTWNWRRAPTAAMGGGGLRGAWPRTE